MKKLLFVVTIMMFSGILFSFTLSKNPNPLIPDEDVLNMPDNVKVIVDNHCYGCHNSESKNTKGKMKLSFDKFGTKYSNIRAASKLKKISEEVSEDKMPPKKFLKHYPDKALNADQKKLLSDWAIQASQEFMNK